MEIVVIPAQSDVIDLNEGDVALIRRGQDFGGLEVSHNIAGFNAAVPTDPNDVDLTGLLIALALSDITESDDAALKAALLRTATQFTGPQFKLSEP